MGRRPARTDLDRRVATLPSNSRDDDPGFRSIGCQIVCSPEVAEEIAQRLREAVCEILDDYSDDDVFD